MNAIKKNPIYLCFAGYFVIFLSIFFPLITKQVFWVKQTPTLLSLSGKWMILLLLVALIFIIYKKPKYALAPYAGMIILFVHDVKAVLPTFHPNQLLQSFSYGIGFYLFILGLLLIGIYYVMLFYYKRKPKHKHNHKKVKQEK